MDFEQILPLPPWHLCSSCCGTCCSWRRPSGRQSPLQCCRKSGWLRLSTPAKVPSWAKVSKVFAQVDQTRPDQPRPMWLFCWSRGQWPGCHSAAPSPHADNTWVNVEYWADCPKKRPWKESWIDCQVQPLPKLVLNKRKTPIICALLTYCIPSDAPSSMSPLMENESNHISAE